MVTDAICGQAASTTFTTMSATAGLEQMRSQLDDGSAYAAAGIPADERGLDFVRPDGTRTVFQAANVARIRRYDDTGKAARGVAGAQLGRLRRGPVRVRLLPLAVVADEGPRDPGHARPAAAPRRSRAPRRSASR